MDFLNSDVNLLFIARFEDRTVIFSDHGFHAKAGGPTHLKVCQPFHPNKRMLVETVLSMLTTVCHFNKVMHRAWACFQARLAFTKAVYNLLVAWDGFHPDSTGFVHRSIDAFNLWPAELAPLDDYPFTSTGVGPPQRDAQEAPFHVHPPLAA